MFPHTVTVYNETSVPDKNTLEDRIERHITILRGVLLDASKATNVRESGLEGADAANLYIPFDVEAVDGITGEKKQYVGPVEFWNQMEDRIGFWTLSDSGNTFFVKGDVVEPDKDRMAIEGSNNDVYNVTKVDMKDFGGLQHWEVGGK